MPDDTYRFLVVDDLFTRYTIYVGLFDKSTSAYCEECDQWVFDVDGDYLSAYTVVELFEFIVTQHDEQIHGIPVEIADVSKPLSKWRN